MRILGLDTSTEWCSVAVAGPGTDGEANEHVVHAHSERLLPMVQRLLADAGLAQLLEQNCGGHLKFNSKL